jgi:inosine triphosphate pyrophosphatase
MSLLCYHTVTMETITFITGNAGKFKEASVLMPELEQCELDLPEIQELDPQVVIIEKLKEARRRLPDVAIVVEDTSLYIDALGGLPGPLIKWFLDRLKAEGIAEVVAKLGKETSAQARCVVGYLPAGAVEPLFFEGVMRGRVVAPRGENGFGWDRLFLPEGSERTIGELSMEEKNEISIRAQAFGKLRDALTE